MSALQYRREEGEPSAPRWVTVGRAEDIPAGHAARVEIDGTAVAIVNCNGELFAVDDTCSHAEASLSEGELDPDDCTIECPLHGSTFDLRTGAPLTLPAVEPVRAHRVAVEDGLIKVAVVED
jgi:3-phenylpropionate/trans-cinnamate dioxygenase ferredoxin subunit